MKISVTVVNATQVECIITELQHSESTYRDWQQMPTLPISPLEQLNIVT